jgi:type III pantothenate kinase
VILLLDIGNTNTHVGLATAKRVVKHANIPSEEWFGGKAGKAIAALAGGRTLEGAAIASVVPRAVRPALSLLQKKWRVRPLILTAKMVVELGIDYPFPKTIGADRLANAVAAKHHFGAPSVVLDFGTAVTFDVINRRGNYVGGIIAPGLAAMTGYLHEKTALLPKITIRETKASVGKSTEEAMLIGAVHGYRGLIRELIGRLKQQLKAPALPVIATGGYAKLMAKGLPEIIAIEPLLTLEGLRLVWQGRRGRPDGAGRYLPRTVFRCGELNVSKNEKN